MREYQFTASTIESEKRTVLFGTIALLAPAALMLLIFKVVFVGLINNNALLWLVVVVPSVVCFSLLMQFMQKHAIGVFALRLEGRHITMIHPDQTVIDLGEVQRVSLAYSADYKRADLLLMGSKDEERLRLRSTATWNGRSSAKDFREVDRAVADIQGVLAQEIDA